MPGTVGTPYGLTWPTVVFCCCSRRVRNVNRSVPWVVKQRAHISIAFTFNRCKQGLERRKTFQQNAIDQNGAIMKSAFFVKAVILIFNAWCVSKYLRFYALSIIFWVFVNTVESEMDGRFVNILMLELIFNWSSWLRLINYPTHWCIKWKPAENKKPLCFKIFQDFFSLFY